MKLQVKRFYDDGNLTLSLLFINGVFRGYGLEDEERAVKIWGETRIPEGTYKLGLRTTGSFHHNYLKKFPQFHKGMLHVLDVPNFEYILIHIGNFDKDTAGCLLVGYAIHENRKQLVNSTYLYKQIYPEIAEAILKGEDVTIEYTKIYGDY